MARGIARERELRKRLRADGYVVYRPGGSLGNADLVAMRAGEPPRLIQVKSDRRSPFAHFGPAERTALVAEAAQAGALAELCWWPPDRMGPRWILPPEWPDSSP